MARQRDEAKRNAILLAAKKLFARQGFHNTSVADIKHETGLPVGSIYTYFEGKDDIMSAIIAEGWDELHDRLLKAFAAAESTENKIRVLTDSFFPELLKDMDLINILLTEAFELTKITEKLDAIIHLFMELQQSAAVESGRPIAPAAPIREMRTAVVFYFLGLMNTARLIRSGMIDLNMQDIRTFMYGAITSGLSPLPQTS